MTEKTEYEKTFQHMRKTADLSDLPEVHGYDFEQGFDLQEFLRAYASTGFQATELGKGISIVNQMLHDEAKIFLSFTGNAISSGCRDIIAWLCKYKFVDAIITTGAGIEEDTIKSFKPFSLGTFSAPGMKLFEEGVGRIGNLFVTWEHYTKFEQFFDPLLEEIGKEPISPSELAAEIGRRIDDENSYLSWAAKNDIPVYCPGIIDGALGDLLYFFKKKHPEFVIDVTKDHQQLIDSIINIDGKTGTICLGGGIAKHYNLNSHIFREGFDYAVYLNVAEEAYGSDSGGNAEEAKTWAKVKVNAPTAKVKADFTITLPLLVAGTFAQWKRD